MLPGLGHLDQDGLDHRQVGGDRHAIVEEAWILELALGVVDVLHVQRPADALHGAALELALDIGRMDRRADILRRGVAVDGDAAGVLVHLEVDAVHAQARPGARDVELGMAVDRPAGPPRLGGEIGKG